MELALGLSLTVSSLLAISFIVIRVKKGGFPGLISKAAASLAFFLTGVVLSVLNPAGNPVIQLLFVLGLMCGVAGDVCLDYRQIEPERQGRFLNKGMLSFGVGHVLYLTAILIYAAQYVEIWIPALAALLAIPIAAVGVFVMVKVLKMNVRRFLAQSSAYLLLLIYVALLTFTLALSGGVPYMPVLTVGAFLFLSSDIVLSFQYFGGQEKNKPLTVVNHVFYYAAQLIYAAIVALIA